MKLPQPISEALAAAGTLLVVVFLSTIIIERDSQSPPIHKTEPARLSVTPCQDFPHFDATIVKDSQTGTEFLVVQIVGSIAITPIENTQTTTK